MAIVRIKRSVTTGAVPTLVDGELAINQIDRRLYSLDNSNTVRFLDFTSDVEKVASGAIANALNLLLPKTGVFNQSLTAAGPSGIPPFSSDDSVPAKIHRITDRVFVGGAVTNAGAGSRSAVKDFIETLIPGTTDNGQLSVVATRANAAIMGASYNSTANYIGAEGAMGTHGGSFIGVNNNSNYGQSVDGVYAEARNYNGLVQVITANYTTNGLLTNGDKNIYNVSNGASISPGSTVTGTGIPANTTVVYSTASGVFLSNAATVSGTQSLTFTPVTTVTNGILTNGSNYVFGVNNATNILPGSTVTGTGIPANTTVTVASGQEVVLSNTATVSGSQSLSFKGGLAGVGYTHDVEVNLINLGGFVQLNPYETVKPGHTKIITSASGRPDLNNNAIASCALEIQYNGATMHTGILFGSQGISPGGHAIAMAQTHDIAWFNNNSRTLPSALIRSDVSVPYVQGGQKQLFANDGLHFQTVNGQDILTLLAPVAAVNGLSITPAVSNIAPQLSAIGQDTNINIILAGKGNKGAASAVSSGSGEPTTSDVPNGTCINWYNSSTGVVKQVCNIGGVLKSVALS